MNHLNKLLLDSNLTRMYCMFLGLSMNAFPEDVCLHSLAPFRYVTATFNHPVNSFPDESQINVIHLFLIKHPVVIL